MDIHGGAERGEHGEEEGLKGMTLKSKKQKMVMRKQEGKRERRKG